MREALAEEDRTVWRSVCGPWCADTPSRWRRAGPLFHIGLSYRNLSNSQGNAEVVTPPCDSAWEVLKADELVDTLPAIDHVL